ncbi:hypothetical protein EYF80_021931 [Liparis tanakae]|uniref:Uncharacterized protein n=1 Tax=Liparis tanakae TaxID=230148 RepID=A0A4Z2HPS3_9TELE|nr:hypothetical protein EYF80_021931 [Liparis tanakae]
MKCFLLDRQPVAGEMKPESGTKRLHQTAVPSSSSSPSSSSFFFTPRRKPRLPVKPQFSAIRSRTASQCVLKDEHQQSAVTPRCGLSVISGGTLCWRLEGMGDLPAAAVGVGVGWM